MTNEPIIHVAIADDHRVVREGLASFIRSISAQRGLQIEVTIKAANGRELLTMIKNAKRVPDVCFLDIQMQPMNGFETIEELKKKWPHIKVLVITIHDIEMYLIRMIMLGASGYMPKSCDPGEYVDAIVAAHKNGMYYTDAVTNNFIRAIHNQEIKVPSLTAREMQVLKYLCTDLHHPQIAEKLHTTTKSIDGVRDSLAKKFNAKTRTGIVLCAIRTGIIPLAIYKAEKGKFWQKARKKPLADTGKTEQ